MSPAARRVAAGDALRKTPAAGTKPRAGQCTSCGADVLEARTTAGLDVRVDATRLSTLGELDAVLAGVPTYTHHVIPGDLAHRYPLVIRSRPAGVTPRQDVHPAHRCGQTWLALPRAGPPGPADPTPDDRPPY